MEERHFAARLRIHAARTIPELNAAAARMEATPGARIGACRRMSVIQGMNAARNPTARTLRTTRSQVILTVSFT